MGGERSDRLGIEILGKGAQSGDLIVGEATHSVDHGVLCQVDEPLDLHRDPVAIQGCFGEVINEVSGVFAITAIKRSEGDGGCDVSKRNGRHALIFS